MKSYGGLPLAILIIFLVFVGATIVVVVVRDDIIAATEVSYITLSKEGNGTILPFEGTRAIENYHSMDPRCMSECIQHGPGHQTSCGECMSSSILVMAVADEGWRFDGWRLGPVDARNNVYRLDISGDMRMHAHFIRIEPDTLASIADSLSTCGLTLIDENEWEYVNFSDRQFIGNGIPDRLEFRFIERLLRDPTINLKSTKGVSSKRVQEAWLANLDAAVASVGHLETMLPGIINVVAAYMTLGDDGSIRTAIRIVEELEAPPLDFRHGQTRMSIYLAYEGDADGDHLSNIEEYQDFLALGRDLCEGEIKDAVHDLWLTPGDVHEILEPTGSKRRGNQKSD